ATLERTVTQYDTPPISTGGEPRRLRLGMARDDGRPRPADQSDLRIRLRLDVGWSGSHLAATRSFLASDQPAADNPPRALCTGTPGSGPGPRCPVSQSGGLAGRSRYFRICLA